MKRFIIEDLIEVADAMFDEIANKEKQHALFVGFYDEAIEVIKGLVSYDDVCPYNINLQAGELNLYDKEYYVELDDNFNLCVHPAWFKEKQFYFMADTDITFITGDCSSAIIKTIRTDEVVEVVYEDELEEECCGNCDGSCGCHKEPNENAIITHIAVSEDGRIHGFEKTWTHNENGIRYVSTYSHYSDDREYIEKLMKELNIAMK